MSTLITDALIVDGTGVEPFLADVLVQDHHVAVINPPAGTTAEETVEAVGRVLAPGFIDLHTHSDLTRFAYPLGETRILQGITTEVIGNCGLSPAPVPENHRAFRASIGPIDVAPDVELDWQTAGEYLDAVELVAASSNVAPLIGHGGIRQYVMGADLGVPNAKQNRRMRESVEESLDAGYWGVSLGLMYAPGEHSTIDELIGIAETVAERHALLSIHMRAYDASELSAAVAEVIEIAERTGVSAQISHLRSVADPGGMCLAQALEMLSATTADVAADAYPYTAGHTTILQLLPSALRAGGASAALAAIAEDRRAVAADLRIQSKFDPQAITIARAGEGAAEEVGVTLAELAEERSQDWTDVAVDLIERYEAAIDVIVVGTRESDADLVLRLPYVSVASDGVALSPSHDANLPHPRSAGTFPRAFRQLLDGGVPLAEIVKKMTSQPARRIGLADRGEIREGALADLVLIRPDFVRDTASYAKPLSAPHGIDDVWVSGRRVVEAGAVTGRTPGSLLRRAR